MHFNLVCFRGFDNLKNHNLKKSGFSIRLCSSCLAVTNCTAESNTAPKNLNFQNEPKVAMIPLTLFF